MATYDLLKVRNTSYTGLNNMNGLHYPYIVLDKQRTQRVELKLLKSFNATAKCYELTFSCINLLQVDPLFSDISIGIMCLQAGNVTHCVSKIYASSNTTNLNAVIDYFNRAQLSLEDGCSYKVISSGVCGIYTYTNGEIKKETDASSLIIEITRSKWYFPFNSSDKNFILSEDNSTNYAGINQNTEEVATTTCSEGNYCVRCWSLTYSECSKCNGTNFSEPDTVEKTVQSSDLTSTGGTTETIEKKEVETKKVVVGEICMNVANSCTSACFYQNGLCGNSLKSFCAANRWSQAELDAAPVASASDITKYYKEHPLVLGTYDQNGNEITYQSIVNQYGNAGKGNITITFKTGYGDHTRYYNAS